jgi:hypothetical protein
LLESELLFQWWRLIRINKKYAFFAACHDAGRPRLD